MWKAIGIALGKPYVRIWLGCMAATLGGVLALAHCAAQQAATVAAVKVTGDLCQEAAEAGYDPQWVTILCKVQGIAGPIAVTLPRASWLRAKSPDAGPGL
jgi:hypothetical protein